MELKRLNRFEKEQLADKIRIMLFEEKLPKNEIAEKIGITTDQLVSFMSKRKISRNDIGFNLEEKELIIQECAKGKTIKEISEKIGKNMRAIRHFCKTRHIEYHTTLTHLSDNEKEIITKKIHNGWSVKKIARLLKRSEKMVDNFIVKMGVTSDFKKTLLENEALKKCGKRKCGKCKKIKLLEDFPTTKSNRTFSYCKQCQNEQRSIDSKKIRNREIDLDLFFRKKLKDIVCYCNRINRECNLDLEFLHKMHKDQNGLCFYTRQKMEVIISSCKAISIDRKDSAKGYTKDNVCLCLKEINMFKQVHHIDKFIEWCKLITEKHDKSFII